MGYSRSENTDFDLKIGRFGAEGGTRSPTAPDPARRCQVNVSAALSGVPSCHLVPGCVPALLHGLLHRLVLDDSPLTSPNLVEAKDLLEVIDDCGQVRSTLLVSQLPVEAWHRALAGCDSTFANSILDRLVQHAHRRAPTSASMRRRQPPTWTRCTVPAFRRGVRHQRPARRASFQFACHREVIGPTWPQWATAEFRTTTWLRFRSSSPRPP